MASCREKKSQTDENDWAFVDNHGAIVPKEKVPSVQNDDVARNRLNGGKTSKSSSKNDQGSFEVIDKNGLTTSMIIMTTNQPPLEKAWLTDNDETVGRRKKKKDRVKKDGQKTHENGEGKIKINRKIQKRRNEDELDFEVIGRSAPSLTTSTIIATTICPPLEKSYPTNDDVHYKDYYREGKISEGPSFTRSYDQQHLNDYTTTSDNDEIEFIQIPETPTKDLLDTSSSSSLEVIDEKQASANHFGSEDETTNEAENSSSFVIKSMNLQLDLPTLAALFCLTTALGFVIGHGIGIATTVLVVKPPDMKVAPTAGNMKDFGKSLAEEERNKEDIDLDENVQKWKSMYRKARQKQENSPTSLKEAHKRLSLENFELKKTQKNMKNELDLMKAMSWHRRSQIDHLTAESTVNRSHVVGLLKKELEYLEDVYKKEKKMADLWRKEEEERIKEEENLEMTSWKKFKDGWSGLQKEDHQQKLKNNQEFCLEKGGCHRDFENMNGVEETDGKNPNNEAEMPLENMRENDVENIREKRNKKQEVRDVSEDEHLTSDKGDMGDILEMTDTQGKHDEDGKEFHEEPTASKNEKDTGGGSDGSQTGNEGSPWYSRNVFEMDNDTILTYENKDNVTHMLYSFWGEQFHELTCSVGDVTIVVMQNKSNIEKKDQEDFVITVQNESPKQIVFFAVLPNGRIRHQEIGDNMKISMTYFGKKEEGKEFPLKIYEATVTEIGKLVVTTPGEELNKEPSSNMEESGLDQEDQLKESSAEEKTENGNKLQSDPIEQAPKKERVSDVDLEVGEAWLHSANENVVYRRFVSSHRYPLNEFNNIVFEKQAWEENERVFYRFPEKMLFEKFVVRDEIFDGERDFKKMEEDEETILVRQCGGEHIATIVRRMLLNGWKDDENVPVLMWYDNGRRCAVFTSITLTKVPQHQVLSHDILTGVSTVVSGNIETMTSYIVHNSDVVRITRTDETERMFVPVSSEVEQERETAVPCSERNSEDESGVDDNTLEREDEGDADQESDSHNAVESLGNRQDELGENRSKKNRVFCIGDGEYHYYEKEEDEKENDDEEEDTGNGQCSLELGETKETHYHEDFEGQGTMYTREIVERVKLTESYQEDDLMKLAHTTKEIQETVSYVYCGDGSVQKTWQRVVTNVEVADVGGTGDGGSQEERESTEMKDGEVDGGIENGGDDEEHREEEYGNHDDDDGYGGNDGDGDHHEKGEYDSDYQGSGDHDENGGYEPEDYHHQDHYGEYNDVVEGRHPGSGDGGDVEKVDRYDEYEDYGDEDDGDYYGDDGDHDGYDDGERLQYDDYDGEVKRYNHYDDYDEYNNGDYENHVPNNQDGTSGKHGSPTEASNSAELQEIMKVEWERMKEEYRAIQEKLTAAQQSEVAKESERRWQEMKHQQHQFDAWKAQVLDELKNNLRNEWEELKKRQEELDRKEKQLEVKQDAYLQTYNTVELERYTRNGKEGSVGNTNDDKTKDLKASEGFPSAPKKPELPNYLKIDEQSSAAWDLRGGISDHQEQKFGSSLHKNIGETENSQVQTEMQKKKEEQLRNRAGNIREEDRQREVEMKIIEEKLDELYATSFGKTKNEIRVTSSDATSSPDVHVKKTNNVESGYNVKQPKCPMKCPSKDEELSSEQNMQVSSVKNLQDRTKMEKHELKTRAKRGKDALHLMDMMERYQYNNDEVGTQKEKRQDVMDKPLPPEERETPLRKWNKKRPVQNKGNPESGKQREKPSKKVKQSDPVTQNFLGIKKRKTTKDQKRVSPKIRKGQRSVKKPKISRQRLQ